VGYSRESGVPDELGWESANRSPSYLHRIVISTEGKAEAEKPAVEHFKPASASSASQALHLSASTTKRRLSMAYLPTKNSSSPA